MDIYHNPPWFIAPFTYERSVAYPNGHRNVIFAQRGIRTLPRGDMSGDEKTGTPDTKMLYAYLKHFGGICASHTSATGMGTDWRDNDPLVEPVVEIYQGDRNNYECDGAPRGCHAAGHAGEPNDDNEAIHPQGIHLERLGQGLPLRLRKFQRPHQHALQLRRSPWSKSPAARRSWRPSAPAAASPPPTTSLLVVKCAEHLMGEEFTLARQADAGDPRRGHRARSRKLDIVRNNQLRVQHGAQPADARPEMDRRRSARRRRSSYYYVRIEQADANLAWSSPMWIHIQR